MRENHILQQELDERKVTICDSSEVGYSEVIFTSSPSDTVIPVTFEDSPNDVVEVHSLKFQATKFASRHFTRK